MALPFLTIAFHQLLEWKISPLHKYDINIIIPPPPRRPILLREYIWCSKDGNQSDFSCSPTYLCFSLTDWLLPSTHSHATPSPRLDAGPSEQARAQPPDAGEAGAAADADSERSVCRGRQRRGFSPRSSLTLTPSLASTLSQTCGTAAFAWRCHSSLCRSYDGRGKKKKEKKERIGVKRKKSPQAPIGNAFISWEPPYFAAFLVPRRLCLGCGTSISLGEKALRFPEPAGSGACPPRPHTLIPTLSSPIKTQSLWNRLRHGLILDPPPRQQAARLTRERKRNSASDSLPVLDFILLPSSHPPPHPRLPEVQKHLFTSVGSPQTARETQGWLISIH